MRVVFSDRQLERCFRSVREGPRRWGVAVAEAYVRRVILIRAARSWDEMLAARALRLHPLTGNRQGQWSLNLTGRWQLIVEYDGDTVVIIEEVSNHYDD